MIIVKGNKIPNRIHVSRSRRRESFRALLRSLCGLVCFMSIPFGWCGSRAHHGPGLVGSGRRVPCRARGSCRDRLPGLVGLGIGQGVHRIAL